MLFNQTDIHISPCIVSKARYALDLKNEQPRNSKRCTLAYWKRVIETISVQHRINDQNRIQNAINLFSDLN